MSERDEFRAAVEAEEEVVRRFLASVGELMVERRDFRVAAVAACPCGCGLPARVTVDTHGEANLITPAMVDDVIAALTTARDALWGPGKGEGDESC